MTVISGDDLRARGITSVSDALASVPGLAVVRSGSFGATTALFARGGESDYVKVLVDGVPLNNPGGVFDFATLTTDNLERIEIVRGPASVVYGSDAVAGVVQLFTRRGTAPRVDSRTCAAVPSAPWKGAPASVAIRETSVTRSLPRIANEWHP